MYQKIEWGWSEIDKTQAKTMNNRKNTVKWSISWCTKDKVWEWRGMKSKSNWSDTKSREGGGNTVQCYPMWNESVM
jgi:hypothetical protein